MGDGGETKNVEKRNPRMRYLGVMAGPMQMMYY